jgi:hypothetical protein
MSDMRFRPRTGQLDLHESLQVPPIAPLLVEHKGHRSRFVQGKKGSDRHQERRPGARQCLHGAQCHVLLLQPGKEYGLMQGKGRNHDDATVSTLKA